MSDTPARISILDLGPEIEEHWDALDDAFQRVMRSGRFILGPEVEAFEAEVAEYLGVAFAVGVNSGTDALTIGLRALGIGPGDEVITTPFTFFATPESISSVGATPSFVDIEPRTFNIDPSLIEAAITERTRAILPVHLYGQACDMEPIMEISARYGLKVLEDVAQAMGGAYRGRKLATIGHAGALSFFPSKNLGGFGDGGMIVTNDPEVARVARMLRAHGSERKYENEMLGYNSRLDELQAALLRVKLWHLDRMNRKRAEIARTYDRLFAAADGVRPPERLPGAGHVFHQYTVRIVDGARDTAAAHLSQSQIASAVYYPIPMHRMAPYQEIHSGRHLLEAELAATQVLSLPMNEGSEPVVASALGARSR